MHFPSCLLLASLLAVPLAASAVPKVPIAAFAEEDQFSNPRLSPDGKYVAVTVRVPSGERTVPTVTVYSVPELKIVGVTRFPVFELPLDYNWVGTTRLVIAKGKELGSRERPVATGEVLAMDVDGSKQEYLFGYNMFASSRRGDRYDDDRAWGYVEGVSRARDGRFFLTSHSWTGSHSMLYDIDSRSASRKLLGDLPMPYLGFVIQRNGTPRFAYGTDEDTYAVLFRRDDASGDWTKLPKDFGRRFYPLAFSADDSEFVASYSATGGPAALVKQDLKTGARVTLAADPVGDITSFMYGADRNLPFAARTSIGIPYARYLDPNGSDAKLHKMLSAQFPGTYLSFINFSDDGKLLLFSVKGDRDPGAYYLFNRDTNKADLLFASMQQIDPEDMAERRPVSFTARDGLQLYGFMTMPKHAAGTKLPLVLLPHGGPHGPFDDWFFDDDAQFLASRGYAVLQVNFRGSGGRGDNFEAAGYRQWGAKIQDDLIDGVKWAIGQGEVDGKRVCAYGVSFGGYSALMLAAREPELFKCAVGYAGIYDLKLLAKEDSARRDATTGNFIKKFVGEDNEELNRFSPALLASRITAPVMLVHGGKDKRAPVEHAELMRAALVKEGRPPEWFLAPNEGHGFYDTANVTAFYEKLEAFLAKHIGK